MIHFLCFNFIFYRPIFLAKKKEKKRERKEREIKNPKLMYMFETLKSSHTSSSFVSLAPNCKRASDDDAKGESRARGSDRAKEKETFFLSRSV